MRFTRTSALAALLACSSLATPALADCVYPKSPASAPNGDTATEEEMLAGVAAVKTYNAEVDAYLGCLEEDAKKKVAEAGSDAKQVQQIQARVTKMHDDAVDRLHARADELNAQIRAYKAKHKS